MQYCKVIPPAPDALSTPSFSDEEAKMNSDTMTIRQMCDTFGVTPRTLRFYEAKELLFPIREGQKRLFTKRDRARLKLILRGKRFGFSLEEIRQLLDLYHMGDHQQTQMARTYDIARERLADMEAQRDELTEAIEELRDQIKWGEKIIASMNHSQKAAE
jgi:DNA-binding transcriptional MerR regulator